MASLSTDKRGNVSVYVLMTNGKRRPVRLGRVGRQKAEGIRAHIGELERSVLRGLYPSPEARTWLAGAVGEMRDKLAAVGLCEATDQQVATVGSFGRRWLEMKGKTVKPATLVHLRQSVTTLTEYFRPDRKLSSVTAADADEWRAWALGTRKPKLSEATTQKRACEIHSLFAFARRAGACGLYRRLDHRRREHWWGCSGAALCVAVYRCCGCGAGDLFLQADCEWWLRLC